MFDSNETTYTGQEVKEAFSSPPERAAAATPALH